MAATPEEADAVLLNTCSIRDNAEQRIWGRLAEMRRLRKARPSLIVGFNRFFASLQNDTQPRYSACISFFSGNCLKPSPKVS